jgi:hypothetical protein
MPPATGVGDAKDQGRVPERKLRHDAGMHEVPLGCFGCQEWNCAAA